MAWGLVAALVGAAASMLMNRRAARRAGRDAEENARRAGEMGRYNSEMALYAAKYNANMANAMAVFNASMVMATTSMESARIRGEALYNSGVAYYVGNYNAALIDREHDLMWQEYGLERELYRRATSRATSEIISKFAASGIEYARPEEVIGQSILGHEVEASLQQFVLRHGAEVQAQKLLEAAAKSRWDATMTANNIINQGTMQGISQEINGRISAMESIYTGHMTAKQSMLQGQIESAQHLAGAKYAIQGYKRDASNAKFQFMNSIIGAVGRIGAAAITEYGNNLTPTPKTDTPTDTSYKLYKPQQTPTHSLITNRAKQFPYLYGGSSSYYTPLLGGY